MIDFVFVARPGRDFNDYIEDHCASSSLLGLAVLGLAVIVG
jgi:hypothetical protein